MNARPKPLFIFLLVSCVLALLACDLSSLIGGAVTEPMVVISAPPSGTRVNPGTEVAIQSTATDARGIAWLELWVDGMVVRNETLPAPQTSYVGIQRWVATTQGTHILSVRAYNAAGAASGPAVIFVEVVPVVASAPVLTRTPNPTTALSPTTAPSPTTTPNPTTAPITVGAQGSSDLTVLQVLLRYDGAQATGTLEITVCNLGAGTAPPFEATLTANGREARLKHAQSLGPKLCVGVFSPGSTFGTFGITSPQNAQVQARVFPGDASDPANNNTLQQTVPVTQLSTLGVFSDLQKYKDCLRTSAPQQCVEYVASDPLGDPREIKKQLGTFISIAPSDYELLANFTVEDDRVCQARVAQYLGIAYPHDALRNRWMTARTSEEGIRAAIGQGHVINAITRESLQNFYDVWIGRPPNHIIRMLTWEGLLAGKCWNAHEMTHLFVQRTPIPYWLNEGLASYVDDPERANVHYLRNRRCSAQGWVDLVRYEDGTLAYEKTYPFVNLTVPPEKASVDTTSYPARTHYYWTGMCFWDYLESTYGHQTFQRVVQALAARRDSTVCVPFLKDIVNPIVGTDLSIVTQPRFGFGISHTNCDF